MDKTVILQPLKQELWERCGVFLINLDRSPERLEQAQQNFSAAGVPFERIVGVDASLEDVSTYAIDRSAYFLLRMITALRILNYRLFAIWIQRSNR